MLVWSMPSLGFVVALAACTAGGRVSETKSAMNSHIPLYQLTRDDRSISVGHIAQVQTSKGALAGQETVTVDVRIDERLWGDDTRSEYTFVFDRPADEVPRLKFPDPVWGRIDLRRGVRILQVTTALPGQRNPVYVDEITEPDDQVFKSVREVLLAERATQETQARFGRRLQWLTGGTMVEKLFAGEAMAKGSDTPSSEVNRRNTAFANAFATELDDYAKISLGTWLWGDIFSGADASGRVAIINATIQAASSTSATVKEFAIDRLAELSEVELLRRADVKPSPEVLRLMEDRKNGEVDGDVRRHLDDIIAALRR